MAPQRSWDNDHFYFRKCREDDFPMDDRAECCSCPSETTSLSFSETTILCLCSETSSLCLSTNRDHLCVFVQTETTSVSLF